MTDDDYAFVVFTIGWEPDFIDYLISPIEQSTGMTFVHGLVGDATRVEEARKRFPGRTFVALSKSRGDPVPEPDFELLAGLECAGVPTVRSMIQGDRVLRYRTETEALGYATLLARRIRAELATHNPTIVLGSHDSIHAAIGLAVSKSLAIPWVALAYPVIPDNLTGFCNALVPNSLVPLTRQVSVEIRNTAEQLMGNVRGRTQKVLAYRPPWSMSQWLRQYLRHGRNLYRRIQDARILGADSFTYPTKADRVRDIVRRSINRVSLPTQAMLKGPPAGRFIYYPLHMAPESMLDTWATFHQDQLALVKQISISAPVDVTLVVKLHFGDPDNYSRGQLKQLMHMPRLRIAHPMADGADFIRNASLVVGVQGTSCLEAALHGKPVLIFGDTPYLDFPRSERALRPHELPRQIERMLGAEPPKDAEITDAYAAYIARYLPGRINDWERPIEADELQRLAQCFVALRDYVLTPGSRADWYGRAPFVA